MSKETKNTVRIGILGSGMVGKALYKGLEAKYSEYNVVISSRDPTKTLQDFKSSMTFKDCAEACDVLILAVKGEHAESCLAMCGESINGKIIIDAANPIQEQKDGFPKDGRLRYFTDKTGISLMEMLQEKFPKAKFVKALNSVGSNYMIDPEEKLEAKPTMFICGDDEEANLTVSEFLSKIGWDVQICGGSAMAMSIEQLCVLWCGISITGNGKWNYAFKLVRTKD